MDLSAGRAAPSWGRDVERAVAIAGKIDAGQVWVSPHGVHAISHLAPYGGVKQSGIGRKSGIEGIREYICRAGPPRHTRLMAQMILRPEKSRGTSAQSDMRL